MKKVIGILICIMLFSTIATATIQTKNIEDENQKTTNMDLQDEIKEGVKELEDT